MTVPGLSSDRVNRALQRVQRLRCLKAAGERRLTMLGTKLY